VVQESLSDVWNLLKHTVDPVKPLSIFYWDGAWQIWPIAILLVIGVIGYLVSANRNERISLKGAARYIFPAEAYWSRSAWMDYQGFFLTSLFDPLIKVATVVFGADAFSAFLASGFGERTPPDAPGWAIVAVQFLVFFVAADFGAFFTHYLEHKIPFLWSFHRVHHSAEVLNPVTTYRKHPVELIYFGIMTGTVIAIALGSTLYLTDSSLTAGTLALMTVWVAVALGVNYLDHSQMWISYGGAERLFISPAMHQIHHSAFIQHRDKNMGLLLSIWDRMFGTYCPAKGTEEVLLGISEDTLGASNPHRTVVRYYLEPFGEAYRCLFPARPEPVRRNILPKVEAPPNA